MNSFENLINEARKHNILAGIIIFDIITLLSFIINPILFAVPGDIDFIFGAIVGIVFALRNKHQDQTHPIVGIVTGTIGGFLSAISVSVYVFWVFILPDKGLAVNIFLSTLIFYLMVGGIIGLIIGGLCGLLAKKLFTDNGVRSDKFEKFDFKNL